MFLAQIFVTRDMCHTQWSLFSLISSHTIIGGSESTTMTASFSKI